MEALIENLVTVDAVIVVTITFSVVEWIKQFCKNSKATVFGWKVKPIPDWRVRGIAMAVAVFITIHLVEDVSFKVKLIYGLFYGGMTPLVVVAVKRGLIQRFFPKFSKTWSGQNKGG